MSKQISPPEGMTHSQYMPLKQSFSKLKINNIQTLSGNNYLTPPEVDPMPH